MADSSDNSDDVNRQKWIRRAIIETIGVAFCISIIGGIVALFHTYNQQEAFAQELRNLEAEVQRQWTQVFALKQQVNDARVDFYRMLLLSGATLKDERKGETHKPEQ